MQHSYTKEMAISRGPKTINALMIFGRYRDERVCETVVKSMASVIIIIGAGIISAMLVMM